MTRKLVSALLIVASLMFSSVALAEPAGELAFVPIELGSDPPKTTVVVVEGDHLWKISARHLTALRGKESASGRIAPYWRQVISVNTGNLRSGDPDLIYPGETIVLPEVVTEER